MREKEIERPPSRWTEREREREKEKEMGTSFTMDRGREREKDGETSFTMDREGERERKRWRERDRDLFHDMHRSITGL